MNFLAHALLAGDDPGLIAGGVAGDWVKGRLDTLALTDDFRRGVSLHRAIDTYAETHPAFRQSRQRIAAERRRWSGIFVDLYYDHLLARDWHAWAEWHKAPLPAFTQRVYAALAASVPHQGALDDAARRAFALMQQEDWLASYGTLDGLDAILARMSRRARHANPLAEGSRDFLADPQGFEGDFRGFLADAVAFAREWRQANPG
jgi:acyl carrier protein phosphodiesterase